MSTAADQRGMPKLASTKDQRINARCSHPSASLPVPPELVPLCAAVLEEEEQPADDDAALLAADRELTNLGEREKAVYRAHPNMGGDDEQRLVCDVFDKALRAADERIDALPPQTLAGAAVKLRRILYDRGHGEMMLLRKGLLRSGRCMP